MNKLFKKISALLILLLVLNISSPVILATTDISKQDSSTKQKNVEFDAKLCTIAEDGNISSGNYEETFDIYTGGLLQITIRVKETGYLKGASIKFVLGTPLGRERGFPDFSTTSFLIKTS